LSICEENNAILVNWPESTNLKESKSKYLSQLCLLEPIIRATVLRTASSRLKVEGTVFPYTDRARPVNDIFQICHLPAYLNSIFPTFSSLQGNFGRFKIARARIGFIELGNRKLGSEYNHKLFKLYVKA